MSDVQPLVLQPNQFVAWQCVERAPVLRSAEQERAWMSAAPERFPYRCLPLVIANSFGWDAINPVTFIATWNGGVRLEDIVIRYPTETSLNFVQSHFGSGVLTFTLGHLFQTSPGINLYVKGPSNWPKDGLQALEGIVETDWCPATFTMNYLFTKPNHPVTFEAGEPYCRFFPIPRYMTESIQPELRLLSDNPGLEAQHLAWRKSRDQFNKGLNKRESVYVKKKWQRDYFLGGGREDWPDFEEHQIKLNQPEFTDLRPAKYQALDGHPESNRTRAVTFNGINVLIPDRTNIVVKEPTHVPLSPRTHSHPTLLDEKERSICPVSGTIDSRDPAIEPGQPAGTGRIESVDGGTNDLPNGDPT
jgi:hypothetical protein